MLKEKIDLIVVDTAHGHTKKVAEIVKKIKRFNCWSVPFVTDEKRKKYLDKVFKLGKKIK